MEAGDTLSNGLKIERLITSIPEVRTGHYNAVPAGLVKVTPEVFISAFMWSIEAIEFRQAPIDGDGIHYSLHMFHFNDGRGFAVNRDKKAFYQFGCQHSYRGMTGKEIKDRDITMFRCTHAEICEKCGHAIVTDSSD